MNKFSRTGAFLILTTFLFGSIQALSSDWNGALKGLQASSDKQAKIMLDRLLARTKSPVDTDRLYLTRGRWFYQNSKFKEAIADYSQVTKGSDYWLEALEEKAWAHLRLNENDQSLSQLQTLLSDLLAPQIGPEPYLLSALIKLKICDYPGVFKQITLFKDRYKSRSAELQNLAQGKPNKTADQAVELIANGTLDWKPLKADVQNMPNLFHRDHELSRLSKAKNDNNQRLKIRNRLMTLAQRDVNEISRILSKMHLVEVEAIQRIHLSNAPEGRRAQFQDSEGETLSFPYNDEVWLDELDNYQVAAKSCQGFGGKKL